MLTATGNALFISTEYRNSLPYLIQNSLLGGDEMGDKPTNEEVKQRLCQVNGKFEGVERTLRELTKYGGTKKSHWSYV